MVGPLSKLLGKNNRGLIGPLCRNKRVQNSICKQTLPLPNSNLSSTDQKSGSRRRGQQTPTQKGSGEERTGRSRLLFLYFLGSQEEWEITTNIRSVQTEYVSGYSVVQNLKSGSSGNSEKPTVYNRADFVPRTDNQRRKVRFGSVSELCVHRNGVPNTQEHSSSAIRQSTGHSGTVTVVQETETGLSKSLSVSSGKTKCRNSICSIG